MPTTLNVFATDSPYNNSLDKFSSIVFLVTSALRTAANYISNLFVKFVEIFVQVLFGWIRGVLIASFILSLLSVAIMDNHQQVIETANTLKCANAQFFHVATEIAGIAAQRTPPIICFWNFTISFTSIFLKLALSFFWTCSDISNVLADLIKLLAKIAESIVLFFFKPGSTSFLGNRFDFKSIVTALQDLISNLRDPLICACTDLSLFSDYLLSVIADKQIPLSIDYYGNAILAFPQVVSQTVINVILGTTTDVPVVDAINQVCSGSISLGIVIDNAVTNFVTIFWPSFTPNRIGSVLAYLICMFTDVGFIFTDSTLHYIWVAAFNGPVYNVFKDANLVPLIEHLDQFGVCLVYTLTPLQVCLAQTVGNLFRLLSSILAYVKGVVQDGENNLTPLKNSLNRFVGQSSFGGGGHILTPNSHDVEITQTSLTCLLATALNFAGGGLASFTSCPAKFADLVNSVIQLFIIPLNLLTEILDNRSLLQGIDGNPLKASTRSDFEEFFEILFDSILDPFFAVFDYLAHFVGCVPLLGSLGNVLQLTVYNLRNIARELRTLLIKIIEFVIELIVLIITVLGEPVFTGSTIVGEFSIFGSIFIDVFTTLFDLVIEFVKNIFNFTIGAFFPVLFGQPSIYASSHTDRSSPATLTECFSTFGDCTCGIFYVNIGKKVCLPLTDTCLADIFPSCGLFQTTPEWSSTTSRKRFTGANPYETPFEYLAGEFPSGTCGEVFRTFANYGKDERGFLKRSTSTLNSTLFHEKPVPSMQATSFFGCLDRLMKSFELSQESNWTLPVDYYIQDERLVNSSAEIVRGSGMFFFDALVDTISMYTYPEYSAGLPTPDRPLKEPVYSNSLRTDSARVWYKERGIEDPLALEFLSKGSSLIVDGFQRSRDMFYEKSRKISSDPKSNPYVKIIDVGGRMFSTALSASLLVARETLTPEIIPHFVQGTVDVMELIQTTSFSDVFPPVQKRDHLRKRDHSAELGGIYFPSDLPNLELNELDDLVINDADPVAFKLSNVMKASLAVGRSIFGPYLELLSRRDMKEEQFGSSQPMRINNPRMDRTRFRLEDKEDILSDTGYYHYGQIVSRNLMPHIYALNMTLPDSLVGNEVQNFHPDVSYLYGMGGMVDFQHHIPFSCVKIHGYCDDNALTGCGEDFYFQTLGLCSSFLGGFGIVSQCGEDFQAFAIYATDSCSGSPLRIAVATPTNPVRCVRFSINPPGPVNDYFCVEYNQCQACPVKQVIPNLQCDYLDQLFHRDLYAVERCWALLVGPIYPPFNFTSTLPTVTDPLIIDPIGNYVPIPSPTPAATTTCTSVCGDRIKSMEVDSNGRLCEECDDGNTRDGDGCSFNCKREKCPRFRTPAFPVAPGQETPPSCSSGTIQWIQSRRTTRYCWPRNIVLQPYSGKSQSTDIKLNSLQFVCSGHNPVITEYTTQDCSGYSVSRTIRGNCSQEGTVDMMYYKQGSPAIIVPAMSVHVGTDITCKFKCSVCGDGIVQAPEQCDSNPYSSASCTYCITTTALCDSPTSQFCQGVCRADKGDIPVDSRYGIQAPSFCQSVAGFNIITCPLGYTCHYFSVQPYPAVKRDIVSLGNYSQVEDVLRMAARLAEIDIEQAQERTAEVLRENERRIVHVDSPKAVQKLQSGPLYTMQSSPVKDNFMHLFAKRVANDVVALFTKSNSDSHVSKVVDWIKRPGYGPDTAPADRGLKYELAFPFLCDTVTSFDGSLGLGLVDGTVLWIYITVGIIVVAGLTGSVLSNFSMTIWMLIAATIWLRLTFGIAAVGCYITASQFYFRLPENLFVEIYDVTKIFNGTCIEFFEPISTSPCDPVHCNQTFINCGDLNYVDGFDSFFGIMEVWLPKEIPQWYRSSTAVADVESALQLLSWQSGYDLYGSYKIAKSNFNFGGVVPHPGHKFCSAITSLSMAEVPLILLVSLYLVYSFVKITIPLVIDVGYLLFAFINVINHWIIIPVQSDMRTYKLKQSIQDIKRREKIEMKIQ